MVVPAFLDPVHRLAMIPGSVHHGLLRGGWRPRHGRRTRKETVTAPARRPGVGLSAGDGLAGAAGCDRGPAVSAGRPDSFPGPRLQRVDDLVRPVSGGL